MTSRNERSPHRRDPGQALIEFLLHGMCRVPKRTDLIYNEPDPVLGSTYTKDGRFVWPLTNRITSGTVVRPPSYATVAPVSDVASGERLRFLPLDLKDPEITKRLALAPGQRSIFDGPLQGMVQLETQPELPQPPLADDRTTETIVPPVEDGGLPRCDRAYSLSQL